MYRLYYCLFIKNVPEITETQDTRTLPNSNTHLHLCRAQEAQKKTKKTRLGAARTRSIKSPVEVQTRRNSTKRSQDVQRPLESLSEVKNSSRPIRQRASTTQGVRGAGQHQPTKIGPRAHHNCVAHSSSSACSRWTPWMLTAIPAQASRCRL